MINTVVIAGRVGLKKDLTYFDSGKCVMNYTVAVKSYNDKTTWVDVKSWNKTAEFMDKYVKVGAFVVVHGRLEKEEWQDPDGLKKSKMVVVGDQVESPKMNGNNEGNSEGNNDNDLAF